MKIKISLCISHQDAFLISKFIAEENEEKPHMIEKNPEKIFHSANTYGCTKLMINNNIIGFMGLYNYGKFYEAGSLCIWKDFRNLGLGTITQKILLDNFAHLPIFLVSNVKKVKSISETTGLFEISIPKLPKNMLKIIEDGGKILSDDSIYLSKQLFSNKLFFAMKEKETDYSNKL